MTSLIKQFVVTLLLGASLSAGTYDDSYSVINADDASTAVNISKFMDGSFEEIVRFNPISPLNVDKLSQHSKERLSEIAEQAKIYLEKGEKIEITLIGHASESVSEDINASYNYALDVFNALVDRNISAELMTIESRQSKDMGYSDATAKGKELSNRVLVSIYIYNKNDVDSDKDGVYNQYDRCPNTPLGVVVDEHGCPIDSDKDGVANYLDKCPDTPFGYRVDVNGCPIDSDEDGVSNYVDLCPDTSKKLRVDKNGCPYTQVLSFEFKFDSSEITEESYPLVEKFAKFMKDNGAYKTEIVGHTDSIGSATYNMTLSKKRANIVKNSLIKEGVESSRLKTTGMGELEPIESNMDKAGRKVNRRIEVKLSY